MIMKAGEEIVECVSRVSNGATVKQDAIQDHPDGID
jgi:hypothetical protein